jgi:hypothetical protein
MLARNSPQLKQEKLRYIIDVISAWEKITNQTIAKDQSPAGTVSKMATTRVSALHSLVQVAVTM